MVLCVQRALNCGRRSGFAAALGSAVGDLVFAVVAFFAVAAVMRLVGDNMPAVKIVAGVVVTAVGVKVMLTNPVIRIKRHRAGKTRAWHDFLTLFGVTMANPSYILAFIAFFAASGLDHAAMSLGGGVPMLATVFVGNLVWRIALALLVVLLARRGLRPRHMMWIDRGLGAVIMAFGVGVIMTAFFNTPVDGILP
jgi:threonine/homoserine/homoserine lactone efflux protein